MPPIKSKVVETTYNVTAFTQKILHIPYDLYRKMKALSQQAGYDEFQGLLPATREGNNFYLKDKFYFPKQTITSTTVRASHEAMNEIIEAREEEDLLRCWWHSHVDMGCTPSGQDKTDIANQRSEIFEYDDFRIMLITNKRGDTYAELHTADYWQTMTVVIDEENPFNEWAEDIILEYVIPAPVVPITYPVNNYNGFYNRGNNFNPPAYPRNNNFYDFGD